MKLNARRPLLYEDVFWLTVVGVIVVFEVAVLQYAASAFVVLAPIALSSKTPTRAPNAVNYSKSFD
ncbi:MAG: hypothetical protein IPH21_09160 [Flavobacteriales bacterium]|nr:hypothetical protein [Flavobacteriales bacterium]